jgi:hypothetical protein
MKNNLQRWLTVVAFISITSVFDQFVKGDPLPGRDLLKFEQQPMIATTIAAGGQIDTYFGHDEFSTAYGVGTTANPPLNYDGRFMADDFADNFTSPVVHVTWWGSYIDDNNAAIPPQPHVQKFLIAFESDVPAPPGGFSQPGQVLQYDVVNLTTGPLTPGSGQFTETLERGPDPVLGEALYRYNAELNLGHEFFEQKDTVYWLKIVALVDVPQPIPFPPPLGVTQWGWHNRDYTIQNSLASPNVTTFPFGEFQDGNVPNGGPPIWHFQDDSVQGGIRFTPGAPSLSQIIVQNNPQPQNYVFVNSNGVGPIDGPQGIELHSKDLAFRLYTLVPEPASGLLLMSSALGLVMLRRRDS